MFLPDVVWHGKRGASVKQDLDYLVVVAMRRQDERRYIRCEGGGVWRQSFPTLKHGTIHFLTILLTTLSEVTTIEMGSGRIMNSGFVGLCKTQGFGLYWSHRKSLHGLNPWALQLPPAVYFPMFLSSRLTILFTWMLVKTNALWLVDIGQGV